LFVCSRHVCSNVGPSFDDDDDDGDDDGGGGDAIQVTIQQQS